MSRSFCSLFIHCCFFNLSSTSFELHVPDKRDSDCECHELQGMTGRSLRPRSSIVVSLFASCVVAIQTQDSSCSVVLFSLDVLSCGFSMSPSPFLRLPMLYSLFFSVLQSTPVPNVPDAGQQIFSFLLSRSSIACIPSHLYRLRLCPYYVMSHSRRLLHFAGLSHCVVSSVRMVTIKYRMSDE